MLDVGFSFPFGAVTNWLFYPSAYPLDGQRRAGPGLGISALWQAVSGRLTFALLPHFMLCNCLAVAFTFLGLCRA